MITSSAIPEILASLNEVARSLDERGLRELLYQARTLKAGRAAGALPLTLHEKVRREIRAQGKDFKDVAAAIGVDQGHFSHMLKGRANIGIHLSRIAAELGVNPSSLFGDSQVRGDLERLETRRVASAPSRLALNIKAAREAAGLTQKQTAEALGGIQQGTYSRWETGKYTPDEEQLQFLADNVFGCNISDLKEGID